MRRTFTAEEKASVFELWKNGTGFSEIANILGSKPGTIFTMLRDTEPPRESWRLNSLRKR
ncbi:hypothetical protein HMPREF9346_05198 [Escherichia coli MS 119-7]|nr:hypothetical protein HMPREF9346_05198 [Escherichia coli MS 119-7]